jgi:hypothetical protein
MDESFRSGSIDQSRSSVNWPLAKVLKRQGDAETGFNSLRFIRSLGFGIKSLGIYGLCFRVKGLEFWAYGLKLRVQLLGFGVRV